MIAKTQPQANRLLNTHWDKVAAMKNKLQQLASQLDDVMHQAEFMANWVQDNRLNRQQMENEFNILIAEVWDSQEQVKAIIEQETTA